VCGEVHNRIGSRQHSREGGRIQHVTFHELKPGGQEFMPGAEIVKNDNFMPCAPLGPRGMTAYVSCPANDQYNHVISFLARHQYLKTCQIAARLPLPTWRVLRVNTAL
jgi:hypothetical protein